MNTISYKISSSPPKISIQIENSVSKLIKNSPLQSLTILDSPTSLRARAFSKRLHVRNDKIILKNYLET